MNFEEFLARIDRNFRGPHGGWQEHEGAAWTMADGGQREGEPDFSSECRVRTHLRRPGPVSFPVAMWWEWTARVRSGGASYRARGYAESVGDGKAACAAAVRVLAIGIAAQFKERHP